MLTGIPINKRIGEITRKRQYYTTLYIQNYIIKKCLTLLLPSSERTVNLVQHIYTAVRLMNSLFF